MPLVLDATVGGAAANAYSTAAAADTYFLGRAFSAAWGGTYTTAQKEQALVFATALLDREKWRGIKGATPASALTQALAWPRRWAPTLEYDAPPEFISDVFVDLSTAYYSELAIPGPIVRATQELAFEILKAGTTDLFSKAADGNRNVKRKTVDVLTTEFFDIGMQARGLALFPTVYALIVDLLRGGAGIEVERV